MKKSIKMLAAGLAIVPCALLLTACGGGENKLVDTSGKYEVVETSSYENVLSDLDTKGFNLDSMLGGLQMSFAIDAEMNMNGQKALITIDSDNYMLNKSEQGTVDVNKIETFSTLNFNMETSVGEESSSMTAVVNQYIKDGNQYIDLTQAQTLATLISSMVGGETLPGYKLYQTLATGAESDVVTVPDYSLLNLLDIVPEAEWGTNIVIEKYEDDSNYKVKTTVKGQYLQDLIESSASDGTTSTQLPFAFNSLSDVVIYIVYTDNQFAGVNISGEVNLDANIPVDETNSIAMTISGNLDLNLVGFNGEIEFPTDFSDYIDMTVA